jgi:endonuclease/exonuclease/phosphatase family metal-dependent hydrolase
LGDAVELTVLVYNIREGGDGRLDPIASVIQSARPDAVALIETRAEPAAALAHALTMELAFGMSNSIFDVHLAWLSREPSRQFRNHRLPALSKTLLEIGLNGVRLFAGHLASRHEENRHPRVDEVRAILGVLGVVEEPCLLVGDLNALRPGDPIGTPPPGVEPRGDALPGAARTTLSPLVEAGFVDCFRRLHPETPGFTYPAHAPWLRLDYVFASPGLATHLQACDVIATDESRRASDHLPVVARFSSD